MSNSEVSGYFRVTRSRGQAIKKSVNYEAPAHESPKIQTKNAAHHRFKDLAKQETPPARSTPRSTRKARSVVKTKKDITNYFGKSDEVEQSPPVPVDEPDGVIESSMSRKTKLQRQGTKTNIPSKENIAKVCDSGSASKPSIVEPPVTVLKSPKPKSQKRTAKMKGNPPETKKSMTDVSSTEPGTVEPPPEPCVVEPKPSTPKPKRLFNSEKETTRLLTKYKARAEQRAAAHERFQYLVSSETPVLPLPASPTKAEIAEAEKADDFTSLVSPDKALPLPHELAVLQTLFQACEAVVTLMYNRKENCDFDRVQKGVEKMTRRQFTEQHVDDILQVYPNAYSVRYDKHVDPITRKYTGKYVLVLTPNLRSDSTVLPRDTPTKGFIKFSGERALQRKREFRRRLYAIVFRAHRDHLAQLGWSEDQLPADTGLKRWHAAFKLDSIRVEAKSSRLPISPAKLERPLTSAREAVRIFQSRALFREAQICQSLDSTPTAANAPAAATAKPSATKPSVLGLLEQMEQRKQAGEKSKSAALASVSASLLAKVRAKEEQRRMLALTRDPLSPAREAMLARLPGMVSQLWCALRTANGKPIPLDALARQIAQSSNSSTLSTENAMKHIDQLIAFAPKGWVDRLDWARPHLRLAQPELEMKQILAEVNAQIARERRGQAV